MSVFRLKKQLEVAKAHLDAEGIMLSDDSPYDGLSTIFTRKPDRGDIPVFKPEGVIRYDTKKNRYLVCSEEKHNDKNALGNMVELPKSGCGVFSSGKQHCRLINIIEHVFVGDAFMGQGGAVNLGFNDL